MASLSTWMEEHPDWFPSGYLSPDGIFFYADYLEHWFMAAEICDWFGYDKYDPQEELDNKGWVHITRSTLCHCMIVDYNHLTDIQKIELKPLIENSPLPFMKSERRHIGYDFPDVDIWYQD